MRVFQFFSTVLSVSWVLLTSAVLHAEQSDIQFNQDIRPLLSANCFNCHGPDEESREADLRLDTREGAFADHNETPILVPGEPQESELYLRIVSTDADEQMPPPEGEHHLKPEEIALIKRWIEEGAKWQHHWSFVTPTRPELPAVDQTSWIRGPLDRFVLSRLKEDQLSPSAEADRRTLIRRVSFDLTGLPPTLAEVEAFLADTTPEAYEKVVDRLLASEHYGEHMARFWLDAARYGDTHGLHLDNYREMWPYRDWVVRALNTNMPYDQFLVEQLAGDLLPEATLDQKIASGFNRCHVSTNEGGSIDEEVYVRNVVDRVSTMGTVCLGMTIGCAVCHDHKFDPVSQQEFYQLFAFFNNLDGQSMDGNVKDPAPSVRVPTSEQSVVRSELQGQLKGVEAERTSRMQVIEPEFQDWLSQQKMSDNYAALREMSPGQEGLLVHYTFDETEGTSILNLADLKKPGELLGYPPRIAGKIGKGIDITEKGYANLGKVCVFPKEQKISAGVWVKLRGGTDGPVISKLAAKENMRGYELSVKDNRVFVLLSGRSPGYVIEVKTSAEILKANTWHHLFFTYDATGKASGVRVFVDGVPQPLITQIDSLTTERDYSNGSPLLLGRSDTGTTLAGGTLDELRMYERRLTDTEVLAIFLTDKLQPALGKPISEWTPDQTKKLQQLYLIRKDSTYRQLTEQLEEFRLQFRQVESEIATTLVFRERDKPREAFILNRGEYDQPGEKVERKTPKFLPPLDEALSQDRLGLATWLVSDDHPLTSRVAVNRFWQQVFGIGIVETSEDFGSQGSPPSHPDLLDWLAVEFREGGWDMKAMMKQLVLSASYRQSSHMTPDLIRRDPRNRLLARGPRFRLDAEMLRDQALSVSGLLVKQVGGPSVKPPQPAGLWSSVGYSGSNTVDFQKDTGPEKVYRRSLYTFWKRTSPPPQMSTFDAPSRESCSTRRERTNTPLQALLLMNEQQYLVTARCLAERTLLETGTSSRERIEWAFERATLRVPTDQEIEELTIAYEHFREAYSGNVTEAKRLISLGEKSPDASLDSVELAIWTMMSSVLLNLDEVVTKE